MTDPPLAPATVDFDEIGVGPLDALVVALVVRAPDTDRVLALPNNAPQTARLTDPNALRVLCGRWVFGYGPYRERDGGAAIPRIRETEGTIYYLGRVANREPEPFGADNDGYGDWGYEPAFRHAIPFEQTFVVHRPVPLGSAHGTTSRGLDLERLVNVHEAQSVTSELARDLRGRCLLTVDAYARYREALHHAYTAP